ncbi:MAG: orotidine-5'-phosphate decarboxylase [Thermodesulfobacteriota bacterium]
MEPKERLIFALDVPDKMTALKYVNLLREEVGLFKVGLELFMAEGPVLLQELANIPGLGPSRFFLDLKLYDIPATVLGAILTVVHGLMLVTIHSDLGPRGLKQLVDNLGSGSAWKILAVTVLTSLSASDLEALGYVPEYARHPESLVVLKAKLAKAAGCQGVICSGREAKAVKEACGKDFLVVCPGIRPAWAGVQGDDQQRIVTPYEAIKNGADYIVVGRPIREYPDGPVAAARRVVKEIADALK